MKRIVTIIMLCVVLLLTACGTRSNPVDTAANEFANLKNIPDKEYLVYDLDTKIVYYMFSTSDEGISRGYGYGYFGEYLGENGHPCQYIDGKIVEVNTMK